jgi:hypothetical protein
MGLDMYLHRKTYVKNWNHMSPEELHQITVKRNKKKHPWIDPKNISSIVEQVGYWRKANCIHDWFVKNCQSDNDNCREYDVELSQLQELYDACILVRDNTKLVDGDIKNGYTFKKVNNEIVEEPIIVKGKTVADKTVAEELLPTASGFFFGSTDYDEYYMQDILDTIKILEPLINLKVPKGFYSPEYTYRASW